LYIISNFIYLSLIFREEKRESVCVSCLHFTFAHDYFSIFDLHTNVIALSRITYPVYFEHLFPHHVILIRISSREKLCDFGVCHLVARVPDPTDTRRINWRVRSRAPLAPCVAAPFLHAAIPSKGLHATPDSAWHDERRKEGKKKEKRSAERKNERKELLIDTGDCT